MKTLTTLALVAVLALAACGGQSEENPLSSLEPGIQEVSYALGMDLARQVAGMPGAENHEMLLAGARDQMAGSPKLTADEARTTIQGHNHASGEEHTEDEWSDPDFATETDQRAYAVGVTVAEFAAKMIEGLDTHAMIQGLNDNLAGGETLLPADKASTVIGDFHRRQQEQKAEANTAEGEAFLAKNAERDGVQVTESGLQYEVVKMGEGDMPAATDKVQVHYRGTLIDGTQFDSSYDRGEPISFPLNGVIRGWTEGLQLMPVGSTFKFYIPSDLGYGMRGAGGDIGPNATLIFDVELLAIESE